MLGSAFRQHRPKDTRPRLLIAGAGGVLGSEVTNHLLGTQAYKQTTVLCLEPFSTPIRGLQTLVVGPEGPENIPNFAADIGLVMFEPGRAFYDRERALWTPTPEQLLPIAKWMHRCGVGTLLVVLPHQPNRLPAALQRGLASLDEVAVSTLGIKRLVFIRSAKKWPQRPIIQAGARELRPGCLMPLTIWCPVLNKPCAPRIWQNLSDKPLPRFRPALAVLSLRATCCCTKRLPVTLTK
jgi:hypothetical protein